MHSSESRSEWLWKDIRGDYVTVPVPPWERRTLINLFMVWTGILSCLAVLWVGGALAIHGTWLQILYASLIGCGVLAIIGGLISYIGGICHLSTYGILRRVFGWYGSWPIAIILSGIPAWGWFIVQTWLFGLMIHDLAPNFTFTQIGWAALWGGLLMTITAYIGYHGLSFLSYVVVPAFFVLVTACTLAGFHYGGIEKVLTYEPPSPIPFHALITAVVGTYICGAIISNDINRFARRPIDGSLAWGLHVLILETFYLTIAAMFCMAMGGTYFSKALLMAGLGLGAYFIAIFGQWTTNDNNLYSTGLAWNLFIPLKKRHIILIFGVLGSLIAFYIAQVAGATMDPLISFLMMLGTWLPPIGGIMIADFYIVQKLMGISLRKRYVTYPGDKYYLVNWPAFMAYIIGGLSAQGILIPSWIFQYIPQAIIGMLISFIIYIIIAGTCVKKGIKIGFGEHTINEYGL